MQQAKRRKNNVQPKQRFLTPSHKTVDFETPLYTAFHTFFTPFGILRPCHANTV